MYFIPGAISLLFLLESFTLGSVHASCSNNDYPELKPELEKYQDQEPCFPLTDTWYQLYRSFEVDPALGGTSKCLRVTQTKPLENDVVPVLVQYGRDVNISATVTLKSSQGYHGKNALQFKADGQPLSVDVNVSFRACTSCMVARHTYITNGPNCGLWVAKKHINDDNSCCKFIFDLLCGTTPKYHVYDSSCEQ